MFWIVHTSPGSAYSLHFHLCFELPILPLILQILDTFTCVLNYPYLSCVFSTLSHRFWNTHTSPGLAYSIHYYRRFELPLLPLVLLVLYAFTCVLNYPYFPWCPVFTLSHVVWITHTSPGVAYSIHFHMCFELNILPLVLRILYTSNCVLKYPYFPWSCIFFTLSPVFWITHTSPYPAYSLHFHMGFEQPILPLVLRIQFTFTCVWN